MALLFLDPGVVASRSCTEEDNHKLNVNYNGVGLLPMKEWLHVQ